MGLADEIINGFYLNVTTSLSAIVKYLQILTSDFNVYLYQSDVITLSHLTTDQTTADNNPVVSFQTPPVEMYVDTLAISFDSNAQNNYKYSLLVDGIPIRPQKYRIFSGWLSAVVPLSGARVKIAPSSNVSISAYNFNSATNDGKITFTMLGYMRKVGN